jgi:hypothetical protein
LITPGSRSLRSLAHLFNAASPLAKPRKSKGHLEK